MREIEFVNYKTFTNKFELDEIVELLEKNNVEYELENTLNKGPLFSNVDLNIEYKLKLKSQDFELLDKLYLEFAENQINQIGNDYYLFDFNDDELLDIIKSKDEWGALDYSLALKILKERGVSLNEDSINTFNKDRLSELGEEKKEFKMLFFGYLFLIISMLGLFFTKVVYLFLAAILIVFSIGSILFYNKVTLPNGERKYVYAESYRKNGKIMLILNTILILYFLIVFFYVNIKS